MICNPTELEGLFKYGKEDPNFAMFLSFIQVEYGLDYLLEHWLSFLDFKSSVECCPVSEINGDTYKEFSQAMKELY
jgi:hypothetical protein